jgi:hypothetical protein
MSLLERVEEALDTYARTWKQMAAMYRLRR